MGDNRGLGTSSVTTRVPRQNARRYRHVREVSAPPKALANRPAKREGYMEGFHRESIAQRCPQTTKKGRQCPNMVDADEVVGIVLCHVHNPWGTFQLQQLAKRKERTAKRGRVEKPTPKGKVRRAPDYDHSLAVLRTRLGLEKPR